MLLDSIYKYKIQENMSPVVENKNSEKNNTPDVEVKTMIANKWMTHIEYTIHELCDLINFTGMIMMSAIVKWA